MYLSATRGGLVELELQHHSAIALHDSDHDMKMGALIIGRGAFGD